MIFEVARVVSTILTDFIHIEDHTMQELQHKLFMWLCIWFMGAFSDILAFGSVKIVKIDFSTGWFFSLVPPSKF